MKEFGTQDTNIIARLVGSLARGFDAPANTANALGSILPALTGIDQSDSFLKNWVTPEEYNRVTQAVPQRTPLKIEDIYRAVEGLQGADLSPQSTLESYGQNVLERAPLAALAALLGPGTAAINPALQATAAGAIPSTAAKEFGFSPLGQDIAQIIGEGAYGVLKGKIPTLKSEQKEAYSQAKDLVGRKKASKAPLLKSMHELEGKLATEVDKSIAEKVQYTRDVIGNLFENNKIQPAKLLDVRRKTYELRNSLPKKYHEYYDVLTKGINDVFGKYASKNPKFYETLKLADKLTSIKNMNSWINNLIEYIPHKYIKGPIKHTIGKVLGGGEKFFKSIAKEPVARKHYFNMAKAAYEQNPASFIKSLTDFSDTQEYKGDDLIDFGAEPSGSLIEFGK